MNLRPLPPQLKWAHPFGCAHAFLAVSAPRHFVFGTFVPIFPTCSGFVYGKTCGQSRFSGAFGVLFERFTLPPIFHFLSAIRKWYGLWSPAFHYICPPPVSIPSMTQTVVKNHRAGNRICDAVNNEKAVSRRAYRVACIVTLSSAVVKI